MYAAKCWRLSNRPGRRKEIGAGLEAKVVVSANGSIAPLLERYRGELADCSSFRKSSLEPGSEDLKVSSSARMAPNASAAGSTRPMSARGLKFTVYLRRMRRRSATVSPVNLRATAWTIAAAIFALDRVTKIWIEDRVSLWDTHSRYPRILQHRAYEEPRRSLRDVRGRGQPVAHVPFNRCFGRGAGCSFRTSCCVPDAAASRRQRLTILGLALVFGGALGNIYDRVMYGQVTDFLEFYSGAWRFAAFNVADSAITVGAALLILDMWRTRKQPMFPKLIDTGGFFLPTYGVLVAIGIPCRDLADGQTCGEGRTQLRDRSRTWRSIARWRGWPARSC